MENTPLKFTQEIKDNWLAALKSGQYVQGFGALVLDDDEAIVVFRGFEGPKCYCCIGVAGDIVPGLDNYVGSISASSPYRFLINTIGEQAVQNLIALNDATTTRPLQRDYSNVIPLIESLPVQG